MKTIKKRGAPFKPEAEKKQKVGIIISPEAKAIYDQKPGFKTKAAFIDAAIKNFGKLYQ